MLKARKYTDIRKLFFAGVLFFCLAVNVAEAANFNKKPTNLRTTTPAQSCRARLTWDWAINPSEDEGPSQSIYFQVFLRAGAGGGDAQTPLVFSNTPEKTEVRNDAITTYSYSFEQNLPPRSYQYSVLIRSGGSSHESGWSSPLNITGPLEPAAPRNLTAAWDNTKTSVDLSWEADMISGVTGFEIWRKDGNGNFELKETIAPSDLLLMQDSVLYRDPNVDTTVSHTYKARAFNAGEGCGALATPVPPKFSGYSNEASVEDVPVAPAPPRNLKAELDAISDSKVFLSWEYASGFEGNFRIEYTGTLDRSGQPLWDAASIRPHVRGGPANFRIEFPGLTQGKKYFFRAQAIRTDARGNGLKSDINAAKTSIETGVATPVDVGASVVPGAGGTGAAHITWRSISDKEKSFEVEFSTTGNAP
ncbi:MAG: fibronectin type III domain-containing protein, partial [Patescibacteria group bacterium]